ncbi:DUF2510 domain-containing protein [Agromyces allii]|uniref:DUF2510 domain-containing protein n=1 Tax=Agromyces allii TaxID=393607 RepID=A0ABN2Q2M4_9MICO|nr:DUF2510 domain-containing protein [Agromyces allii]
MPESRRVAGWYDDEADAAALRYWDGASWTPHTVARADAASAFSDDTTLAADAPPAETMSIGVTALRGAGARGGCTGGRGAAHGRGTARTRGASTTPVPVDTLVDDFSISEMTSMRAGVTPSVTPIASGPAPVATAPPSFPTAPSFPAAPSFAAEPSFSTPPSFVRMPSAPNEHTTVPLPPTGFRAASARQTTAGDPAYVPAGRPSYRRIAWIASAAVVLGAGVVVLLANLIAGVGAP